MSHQYGSFRMIRQFRPQGRAVVSGAVLVSTVCGFALQLLADDPKPPVDAKSRQFLITGQEPAEPFVPLRPRTMEDTEKLEAIKQFCIACKYESEYRWSDAIEAYRKAIAHDPKSIALYRAAIHACKAARRMQDAVAF